MEPSKHSTNRTRGFCYTGVLEMLHFQSRAEGQVETEQSRLRMRSSSATKQLLHSNTALQETKTALQFFFPAVQFFAATPVWGIYLTQMYRKSCSDGGLQQKTALQETKTAVQFLFPAVQLSSATLVLLHSNSVCPDQKNTKLTKMWFCSLFATNACCPKPPSSQTPVSGALIF